MVEKNYQELYKKYRPRIWEEIIGQDTVVQRLRNIVTTGHVPTGFMFFGTHGCGKTSAAFILAKALNCSNLKADGNPCNECPTCKSIDEHTQIGIRYMSMANQGSAEDIRRIVTEAQLKQPIKKQVWILDECHRLSGAAFDSLLIPLESERMKTLFIFCSTEPDKVPKTITSRLQICQFLPVNLKTLALHLRDIARKEKLDVTPEQMITAARNARGSVRDSIRNLENIISQGSLAQDFNEKILHVLVSLRYTELFKTINEMQASGVDFTNAAQDLYDDLSNTLLIAASRDSSHATQMTQELLKSISPTGLIGVISMWGKR